MTVPSRYSLQDILEVLPHREPFVFVDEIVEFVDGLHAIGVKSVKGDEWFFKGHFPQKPIMPGVLILEALAQTGCFFCLKSASGAPPGTLLYLTRCEKVRWINQVIPPATITLKVTFTNKKLNFWFMDAEALVDGKQVCVASITAFADTQSNT